jgi:hypothetical protein
VPEAYLLPWRGILRSLACRQQQQGGRRLSQTYLRFNLLSQQQGETCMSLLVYIDKVQMHAPPHAVLSTAVLMLSLPMLFGTAGS